jgi:uncharacterized protein (DUF302 family)
MNTGLITHSSAFSVKQTIDRIASFAQAKGMTIFGRIDHGDNAKAVGLSLRPTELMIFGNPRVGTILMQDKQVAGLDLPFKALAWEDEAGKTWLTYNDPRWISERHLLTGQSGPMLDSLVVGIKGLMEATVKEQTHSS